MVLVIAICSILLFLILYFFVGTQLYNCKFSKKEFLFFIVGIVYFTIMITLSMETIVNVKKETACLQTWTEVSKDTFIKKRFDIKYLLYTDNKERIPELLNDEIIIKDNIIYKKE